MAEAGIRELRDHLSKYLDRVRAGEEVLVTDRGVAIARVIPVDRARPYDRLVQEGLIHVAQHPDRTRPAQRVHSEGTVSDLVGDQRR